jgi:mono/diheme cytochrome c family protein
MTNFITLLGALLLTASMVAAQTRPTANQARLIAHGKYLVTRIAMCGDCHSPHNEKGAEIPGRELQGSALFFKALQPVPGWVNVAPPIAGLEGWTRNQAVHFLVTGLDRSNKMAAPPMPTFRMSRHDAEAVVAYLKSLPTAK